MVELLIMMSEVLTNTLLIRFFSLLGVSSETPGLVFTAGVKVVKFLKVAFILFFKLFDLMVKFCYLPFWIMS